MSRNRTKICLGCQRIFDARKDAKTCSARCRKRYQRAKFLYYEAKPAEAKSVIWQRSSLSYKKGAPSSGAGDYAT